MWFTNLLEFEDPDRNELKLFVDDVRRFMRDVLFEFREFQVLFDGNGDLLERAKGAFDSREMDAGFGELTEAINWIEPMMMERHGLYGKNLRFKFGVLGHVSREFPRRLSDQFSVRGWFQRIVAAIDALLDSLIDATGGAGGLIKEFKDALGALAIARS